jgi:hypothetical protein
MSDAAVAVSTGCLGLSLLATFFLGRFARQKLREYDAVTSPFYPGELKDMLSDPIKAEKKGFKVNRQSKTVTGVAVITGLAQGEPALKSQLTPNDKFAYLLEYRDAIYSAEQSYRRNNRLPGNVTRILGKWAKRLEIRDPMGKESCEISLDFKPHAILLKPSNRLFLGENITADLDKSSGLKLSHGLLVALDICTLGIFALKGVKIGYSDCQIGVKVDAPLIALGEIVYDGAMKTLKMTKTRALEIESIARLKNLALADAIGTVVLTIYGVLAVITSIGFCLDVWSRRKAQKVESAPLPDNPTDSRQMQCVVCWVNRRVVMIEPCHHLVMCNACSKQYKRLKCPVCNQVISSRRTLMYA